MALPGTRHVGLKVVSVVLASLLWLLVSGEQTVERALRIPLEFTNLPAQLELVGEPPDVVDVRLRGSSGTMSRIAAGELAAVLAGRVGRLQHRGARFHHHFLCQLADGQRAVGHEQDRLQGGPEAAIHGHRLASGTVSRTIGPNRAR